MSSRDLSPLLPASVQTVFRCRRCTGVVSDSVPSFYTVTTTLASITLSDSSITPKPVGVPGTTKVIHSDAIALFTVGVGTPTNSAALTSLANQLAADFYDWRSQGFDSVLNGVCNVAPCGLVDTLEICHTATDCYTRVQSAPWNGEVEETHHLDPAQAACTDLANSGNPVTKTPFFEYYGAPETCDGGGAKATPTITSHAIASIAVTAGGAYASTPTVIIVGDGSGATATATVTSGAVASVAVTAGGTGYTWAIVSFKGGGNKLQRSRFRLSLQDGRLVSTFISYDSIG